MRLAERLNRPERTLGRLQGIKIEPKEDIVKRLGRSPDCADAVVLATLLPNQPSHAGPQRLVAG